MSRLARVINEGRWVMVAVQGLAFLAVAVTAVAPVGPQLWSSLGLALAMIVAGAVGVVWTGRSLGGSLTPSPVPNGVGLVARGLYRWVRHPMYTALILMCAGVAVSAGRVLCWASVFALVVFFEVKTRVEERYLVRAYEGYDAYAARTGKFLPGLGRRRPRTQ
ncbi:methyltransferase family protein [Demequina globuliformis]|uniref:methyltransferase family protein n=1 Tax=Demequina globuliformis TaxID=676202 RepID=UPI0007855941|nr:isoprenylcysteine carboxylmethyltransferase family protein [Demequina globuliformis]